MHNVLTLCDLNCWFYDRFVVCRRAIYKLRFEAGPPWWGCTRDSESHYITLRVASALRLRLQKRLTVPRYLLFSSLCLFEF